MIHLRGDTWVYDEGESEAWNAVCALEVTFMNLGLQDTEQLFTEDVHYLVNTYGKTNE